MAEFGQGDERVLKPVEFGEDKFNENKVYPRKPTPGGPDQYGQVGTSDKDKSKLSGEYTEDVRRTHTRADTDTGPRALHHTLGTARNQASPGDHNHDGRTSRKIGPLEMDPVNLGKTRPVWTIPLAPSTADLVGLLARFVNFRQV
jgi:hypothetical protein